MDENSSAGFVYFEELVESAKKQCQKSLDALVKLGFDPKKAKFTCDADYEKMALHARFSEYFMEVLRTVVNHGDVKKVISIFKKTKPEHGIVFLEVHKKEVVAMGEQGPSLMIFLVNRACKKIKVLLTEENKELRQLKKDIRASFHRIVCCKSVSVKIHKKKYIKIGKEVIIAQIKLSIDDEKHTQLKKEKNLSLLKKVNFINLSPNKIISDVNKYIQAFL